MWGRRESWNQNTGPGLGVEISVHFYSFYSFSTFNPPCTFDAEHALSPQLYMWLCRHSKVSARLVVSPNCSKQYSTCLIFISGLKLTQKSDLVWSGPHPRYCGWSGFIGVLVRMYSASSWRLYPVLEFLLFVSGGYCRSSSYFQLLFATSRIF